MKCWEETLDWSFRAVGLIWGIRGSLLGWCFAHVATLILSLRFYPPRPYPGGDQQ